MSIKIWWDTQTGAYKMATPYRKEFIDAMKMAIPVSERLWDPTTKIWTITEAYMEPIRQLAEKVYMTKADVVTKAQAEARAQAQGHSQNLSAPTAKLDDVLIQFIKLLPYEAAQKAFRHAAMLLHPDKPGGNADKMSQLNAAWQRLEIDLYKKVKES